MLERLWLLFRHDLSRFTGDLPRADGTFRSERLDAALTDPGWAAFLACCEDSPVGFAFVRSLERQPFILNSFFVVAAARGTGVGSALAHQVVSTFLRDVGGGGNPQRGLDRGTPRRARPPAPASRLVDNLRSGQRMRFLRPGPWAAIRGSGF